MSYPRAKLQVPVLNGAKFCPQVYGRHVRTGDRQIIQIAKTLCLSIAWFSQKSV
jgi:hypothetical protein